MTYDIGILGGGESGVGAALLASTQGLKPFVSDYGVIADVYHQELVAGAIHFEDGGHDIDILASCKEVIKSPGIPHSAPIIQELIDSNTSIISEIEFAYRYLPDGAKLIAITGSNGKTTTTNLTHHLLLSSGESVVKGGNLGISFARLLLDEPQDYYVIEISSFQLDDIYEFRPDIAVLLNITPDHLDRYGYDFGRYADAKMKIAQNQKASDYFIYNEADDHIAQRLDGLIANQMPIDGNIDLSFDNPYLKGEHNQFNTHISIEVAVLCGVEWNQIIDTLPSFINDHHRMQPVAEIDGVQWINDSKATNVDAVMYALQAIDEPIIWMVGGVDKGNDYSVLMDIVKSKVSAIVALGIDNAKILKSFNGVAPVHDAASMQEAIRISNSLASKGSSVLLSPACASFDLFKNYKDRGEQFIQCVLSLKEGKII